MPMQVPRGSTSHAAFARFLLASSAAAVGLLLLASSAGCFTQSKAREALTANGMSNLKLERSEGGFSFTGTNRQGWSCSGFIRGKSGLFTSESQISSFCQSVVAAPRDSAPRLEFPSELRYTNNHEWLRPTGDRWRIGVTQYVTEQAGDIMSVELATPGTVITRGEPFGKVESVMVAQPLHAPVSGKVVAVNEKLRDTPELVNAEPYTDGWMIEVEPSDRSQADELLTADAYGQGIAKME